MRINTRVVCTALLAVCSSLPALASSVGYSDRGFAAATYSFTAPTSADEIGYFYGSTALYHNVIGVWADGVQLSTFALNNHTSSFGQSFDFGHVNAGETIVIALEVLTRGYTVYSDPVMNADGVNHVYATLFAGQTKKGATIGAGTFLSFEDLLLPRSDLNYNDEDVVFSDLSATAVAPEPRPLGFLVTALLMAGLIARPKRFCFRT